MWRYFKKGMVTNMAKKVTTVFFCQECGYETSKWMGQCPGCKQWNTLVEEKVSVTGSGMGGSAKTIAHKDAPKPVELSTISMEESDRISTNIKELDRVLGGGIIQGSLTLVGGDPGIGKSTLLLQVCRNLSGTGHKVLYISGEESLKQIKLRANRIGEFKENMLLLCETNLGLIEEAIKRTAPEVVIIDSIQTMYQEEVSSAPGSVSQVREATNVFMQLAKGLGISIFIVGHVTKEGTVAGPRVLEHMVDTVLYFEGDRHASYRILRGVKNRFGSTNEIGVFEMRKEGLVEVVNPSEFMLNGKPIGASGSVVVCSVCSAVYRIFMDKLKEGRASMLSEKYAKGEVIHIEDIIDAVIEEDVLAIEVVEEIGTVLGRAIAGLINIFNPELIVIGGNVSAAKEYLLLPIKSAIQKHSLNIINSDTTIKLSKLGKKAGPIGSCMLSRSKLLGLL